MATCWASVLGDCSDKISREHLVSASLFMENDLTVQGFSWRKEPKKVGLASFASKILCTKHNSDLSEVDVAGAAAFEALRQFERLMDNRKSVRTTYWHIRRFRVDGPLLERWFLKTLINIGIAFGGNERIGVGSEISKLSADLVEIAFGKKTFEGRAGLYTVFYL